MSGMKQSSSWAAALIVGLTLVAASPAFSASHVRTVPNPVPGRYIVVYRNAIAHPAAGTAMHRPSVRDIASSIAASNQARVTRSFDHAILASVMTMSAADAEAVAMDPRVAYVEQDGYVGLAGSEANPPSWGLDRIDQHQLPLDQMYDYPAAGAGIDVYVLDSGIRSTHLDFGGRVDTAESFTAIQDGYGTEDCIGHGTMVAGIIGGTLMGVAKQVTLHSVRVADCYGGSSTSLLIAGVDWITQEIEAKTIVTTTGHGKHVTTTRFVPPSIVNLSLSATPAVPLDQAIATSIRAGAVYVVAAGNTGGDACTGATTANPDAIIVGASNASDQVASFSNQGPCVDVFAPGVNIPSDSNGDDTAVGYLTGTSAAAPFVAGAAAVYWSARPDATPADVEAAIVDGATDGVLAGLAPATANRLLYSGSASQALDVPPSAAFTYQCKNNGDCSFDASSSSDDVGIVSYSWDFGDGWAGVGIAPDHAYATHTGSATVILTVTDGSGQSSSVSQVIAWGPHAH